MNKPNDKTKTPVPPRQDVPIVDVQRPTSTVSEIILAPAPTRSVRTYVRQMSGVAGRTSACTTSALHALCGVTGSEVGPMPASPVAWCLCPNTRSSRSGSDVNRKHHRACTCYPTLPTSRPVGRSSSPRRSTAPASSTSPTSAQTTPPAFLTPAEPPLLASTATLRLPATSPSSAPGTSRTSRTLSPSAPLTVTWPATTGSPQDRHHAPWCPTRFAAVTPSGLLLRGSVTATPASTVAGAATGSSSPTGGSR